MTDASLWVSALLPEDVHHAASRAWLAKKTRDGQSLVAPWILLAEVSGAIARRTGQPDLGERALEQLNSAPGLELVSVDEWLGRLAAHLALRLSLKGADAVYVAAAHRAGIPLITWDTEQRERAASVIPTFSPAEL